MLSIVTKRSIIGLLFICRTASVPGAPLIEKKPPRYIYDPLIGLRVAANARLDPLPAALIEMCERVPEDKTTTAHLWIFANASNAGASYYVLSGYSEVRHTPVEVAQYNLVERGGMYIVANGKCVSDPADEYFKFPTDEVPLPVLRTLATDHIERLARAFGGIDKLRAAIKNQHIDLGRLPSVMQDAYRPYLGMRTLITRKPPQVKQD